MRYKHCISLKTRTLRFKFRMAIKKSLGKSNKCFKTIMFLYMHGGYNWCASLRQKVYIRRRLYLQLFVSHLIKNENKSQLNTHTTSMSLISQGDKNRYSATKVFRVMYQLFTYFVYLKKKKTTMGLSGHFHVFNLQSVVLK